MNINMRSKDYFVESLRAIRTSVNFLLSQNSSEKNSFRSFLVTSIHPGEGKTFTSINLARIFASSEKKVLVVDFDMHKPKVHKVLDLKNDFGNSTNLSNKSIFKDSIRKLDDNLDVITSGPVPPNPSELVLSQKVNELIKFAQENYDFLFILWMPAWVRTFSIF